MVEAQLFDRLYPGRTLIVGQTPSASHYLQVYWTMGRSEILLFVLEDKPMNIDKLDMDLVKRCCHIRACSD
jgi:hypothetical protein